MILTGTPRSSLRLPTSAPSGGFVCLLGGDSAGALARFRTHARRNSAAMVARHAVGHRARRHRGEPLGRGAFASNGRTCPACRDRCLPCSMRAPSISMMMRCHRPPTTKAMPERFGQVRCRWRPRFFRAIARPTLPMSLAMAAWRSAWRGPLSVLLTMGGQGAVLSAEPIS
jgi:hypothetical protein